LERASSSELIKIKLQSSDINLNKEYLVWQVGSKTPLRKLMEHFCEEFNQTRSGLRFSYCGKSLTGEETPHSLEMKPYETIHIYKDCGSRASSNSQPQDSRLTITPTNSNQP
jgi:hypothetical protein